jgi:hypothetical protein
MVNIQNQNHSATLTELMEASFVRYKGCLIELPSFKALGKIHLSFADAKQTIDNAFSSLKNSIR